MEEGLGSRTAPWTAPAAEPGVAPRGQEWPVLTRQCLLSQRSMQLLAARVVISRRFLSLSCSADHLWTVTCFCCCLLVTVFFFHHFISPHQVLEFRDTFLSIEINKPVSVSCQDGVLVPLCLESLAWLVLGTEDLSGGDGGSDEDKEGRYCFFECLAFPHLTQRSQVLPLCQALWWGFYLPLLTVSLPEGIRFCHCSYCTGEESAAEESEAL